MNCDDMKLFLRILKIIAVLVILVTISLFTAALIMQDRVADIVLKSLNKSISTKFEFETVKLSFLRKFPKASLDLKNVLVHSSPGFNKSAFEGAETDTLLSAKSVFIEFDMIDIYNGIYDIERIGIRDGILRLFTDTSGMVNYDIKAESDKESAGNFTIDLKRVSLNRLKAYYNNLAVRLLIEGTIENGYLKSRISGNEIDFNAVSDMQINNFRLYNTRVASSLFAGIDINLHSSDSGTVFNKGTLEFDNYTFSLKGSVSSDNLLDLSVTGDNLDIQGIKKYLPYEIQDKIYGYNPAGTVKIRSNINGLLSRTSYPEITVDFDLNNGSVTLSDKALNLNGIFLSGVFSNGSEHVPESSSITIKNFSGNLGSAEYSGSLSVCNFDSLNGTLQLKGRVIPSEIRDFFRIKAISSSEGSFDIDLTMKGALPGKKKITFPDVLNLNPSAIIEFNSLSMGLNNNHIKVDQINGSLVVSDSVIADNMRFGYNDHNFVVDGIFKQLPEWLAGRPVMLIASGRIKCDHLVPQLLFPPLPDTEHPIQPKAAFSLPGDIMLDLIFMIDTFRIRQFKAERIHGTLSYKPKLVNFKTLTFNSLDGRISGNGFIVQNPDKSFSARGSFDMEDVNVNSAFRSFNNFGQDFIKAENINGNLSGSLSLLLPADSLWKIDVKSINAEGKYVLTDGALVDFEPVRQLSEFIELSELENIRFEKLENDFFIKNNFLYIPQMDVNSSAAEFSVNGKHGFNNDYEYHVRVLLSEILSKKLKKPKPNTTEFGAVKDDGLGRTSVLLKIEDKGDDVKVTYDMKAAGNTIRNDIKAERKNLRTILNEEYGWFKNDTAAREKPKSSTPRFRIIWDETDTAKVKEQPEERKENPLKNLFRKKNY
jgi:hypothetical protein